MRLHRVETLRPDDSAAETQGHEHDERVTRDGHEVVREQRASDVVRGVSGDDFRGPLAQGREERFQRRERVVRAREGGLDGHHHRDRDAFASSARRRGTRGVGV